MAYDNIDADTAEALTKYETPTPKGIALGGLKGVSLGAAQSEDVRERLLQMIREREAGPSTMDKLIQGFALAGSAPGTFQANLAAQKQAEQAAKADLFNMRVQLAQMDTEQARLQQAKEQAAQDRQMFFGSLGMGGAENAGGDGGQMPGMPSLSSLDNATKAQLFMLYRSDPKAAIKEAIRLTQPTDMQKQLLSAGITPGSPQWKQLVLGNVAPSIGDMIEVPDPNNPGFTTRVPKTQAQFSALNMPQPGVAPTPQGGLGAVAPTPQPVPAPAPAPQGGIPEVPAAPAEVQGGLGAVAPANYPRNITAGAAPVPQAAPAPVPQAAPVIGSKNPFPRTDPRWAEFEKKRAETAVALEQKRAESNIALEQKAAEVPLEAKGAEAKKMGEEYAAQQTAFADTVKQAPANATVAQQLSKDIAAVPGLIGKLNRPSFASAFANAIDQGIQLGQFGSLSVPVVKDLVVQLDPEVRKDPKKMEAYQRIVNNMTRIGLEYARAVNKGMGSMSNYERSLIEKAVGDVSRLSANNLAQRAKVVELDAKNAMEQERLWKQMSAAGRSWKQFKESKEFEQMRRAQFYRTAKALNMKDAKYPGDQ